MLMAMQFDKLFLFLISVVVVNIGVAQNAPSAVHGDRLVRGCYLSLEEYLTNSPSFVDSFYLTFEPRLHENWEGTLSRTPRYGGKNKKIKDIWGFSDGYNAYIYYQVDYFKLENDSSGIYFYAYDIMDYSKAEKAGITGGIFGGVVGSAIGVAIVIEKEKSSNMSEKLRYTIHEKYGYVIHPDLNESIIDITSIPREEVVFYRSIAKDSQVAISCLANDSIEFILNPYSVVSLFFDDGTFDLKLTCSCEGNVFTNEVSKLEPFEVDYFEFAIPKRTGIPVVEKVTIEEGQFNAEMALKKQERRERHLAK